MLTMSPCRSAQLRTRINAANNISSLKRAPTGAAVDMLHVPYYHPAMEEALQAALHDLVDGMGPQSSDSPELRPLIS